MAFADEDIAEIHAQSVGGRREYFSGDAYSFRRLARLKNDDILRLYKALWAKRDRVAKVEKYRARELAKYYRAMQDPAKRKRLREINRRANAKARKKPARRAYESHG